MDRHGKLLIASGAIRAIVGRRAPQGKPAAADLARSAS
jgi:hypothetical protein